jgi:HlyD family secretion protein
VRVESRSLAAGVTASGLLAAREEAAVGSELSGYRVAQVMVEEGAHVKQGQTLAQLDTTLLRAQIDQQAARTAQAQADSKRVEGLDGQGVLSQEAIETRRFEAKAQEAALAELRTRLSRMTITAPFNGLVIERTVNPGQISGGGTTAWFRIVRDDLVELQAELNETDLAAIRIGQAAQVTLPSGQIVGGQVRLISPRVDPQTKLGIVRVRLPVRGDLRPGGYARAAFFGGGGAYASVPETAVRYDSDGAAVMTVAADGKVSPRAGQDRPSWRAALLNSSKARRSARKVVKAAGAFVLEGDHVKATQ